MEEAKKPIHVTATPVFYHDCVALGKNTILPRALMADSEGEVILYWQHKCPFCGQTGGQRVLAPGVSENSDGTWSVDMTKVERLRPPKKA